MSVKVLLVFRGKAKDFPAFMAAAMAEEAKNRETAEAQHGQC